MQKTELEQQQKAIEARFNELTQQKQQITEELLRLQGQYSLLVELINNYPKEINSGSKSRRAKELASQS